MCALFGWLDYKHIIPHKFLKNSLRRSQTRQRKEARTPLESHIFVTAKSLSLNVRNQHIKSTSMLQIVRLLSWGIPD